MDELTGREGLRPGEETQMPPVEQKPPAAPPTARDPREVVEAYRRPTPEVVVRTFVRPLPGRMIPPEPPKPRSRRGLWIFLACVGALILLAAGSWLLDQWRAWMWYDDYGYTQPIALSNTEITIPTWPTGQGAALAMADPEEETLTAQEIYQQVNPAVVTVMVQTGEGVFLGTGVIFTEDGYVLTNYHVVEGGTACTVGLPTGRRYEGLYVAGDAANDLAILKVDSTDLPTAEFGNSDLLTVGDRVYAIGNPLGVELRGTMTDGIVSAINRDVAVEGRTMTLIQTNAALNHGNSGGPLISESGQVVGINTVKMSSTYGNVEGLGFAIPSASVYRIVNDLLTTGQIQPEPVLGVTVAQAATQVEEGLWGLEVWEVTPGSAAARAGIRVGDFLTAVDGKPLASSQDLLNIRRQLHIGDRLPVTIWREGRFLEMVLQLEAAVET